MLRFYEYIREPVGGRYDSRKAAQLEVQWWAVHRNRDRYRDHAALTAALAATYAEVYQVPAERVTAAAEDRAQAMDLSDQWQREGKAADSPLLGQIADLLVRSYQSLSEAVGPGAVTGPHPVDPLPEGEGNDAVSLTPTGPASMLPVGGVDVRDEFSGPGGQQSAPQGQYCPGCGRFEPDPWARFCGACGGTLDAPGTTDPGASQAAVGGPHLAPAVAAPGRQPAMPTPQIPPHAALRALVCARRGDAEYGCAADDLPHTVGRAGRRRADGCSRRGGLLADSLPGDRVRGSLARPRGSRAAGVLAIRLVEDSRRHHHRRPDHELRRPASTAADPERPHVLGRSALADVCDPVARPVVQPDRRRGAVRDRPGRDLQHRRRDGRRFARDGDAGRGYGGARLASRTVPGAVLAGRGRR